MSKTLKISFQIIKNLRSLSTMPTFCYTESSVILIDSWVNIKKMYNTEQYQYNMKPCLASQ